MRAMFDGNSRILRLDRNLPDSSESTLDLKVQRRGKHGIPGNYVLNILIIDCLYRAQRGGYVYGNTAEMIFLLIWGGGRFVIK